MGDGPTPQAPLAAHLREQQFGTPASAADAPGRMLEASARFTALDRKLASRPCIPKALRYGVRPRDGARDCHRTFSITGELNRRNVVRASPARRASPPAAHPTTGAPSARRLTGPSTSSLYKVCPDF